MLYFLPAPIGNLSDISLRTLEILQQGEVIFCEDTRVTKKLLHLLSQQHNLDFPEFNFFSLHSHNEKDFLNNSTIDLIKTKNVIYMSDAGMPCVSDPGALLVDFCIHNELEFDTIPGANALLTAYASSGFSNPNFSFFGFLPHKEQNRKEKLSQILKSQSISILYESPHRLLKLLEELNELAPDRTLFLTKELTKLHQKRFKGSSIQMLELLKTQNIKGEWVVIIENDTSITDQGIITLEDIEPLKLPPKQKAKLIAKLTGKNIKEIYNDLIG